MKKVFTSILCSFLLIYGIIGLTACNNNESESLPDLANCKIGYELPVYPQCDFYYKVDENFTVHIENVSATLTKKNEIHQGDTLDTEFYPYTVTLTVSGTTDPANADQTFYFRFRFCENSFTTIKAIVNSNGSISCEKDLIMYCNYIITFHSIELN